MMLTRLAAVAAWTLVIAGTAYAQGTNAGAGRPRSNAGSTGGARPQAPPTPASLPTTGSTSLLPGAGLIVAPEDGARPPRPEASPGTPANPSGLKKPD